MYVDAYDLYLLVSAEQSYRMSFKRAIITHGGAGSSFKDKDGTDTAAELGIRLMQNEQTCLGAAVAAVKSLENDSRFNAGIGSQIRCDGKTIQMDASCMKSDGSFGAVACLENVKNPIEVAAKVLDSPNVVLCGSGAMLFAQNNTFKNVDNSRPIKKARTSPSCDTVGAVSFDGKDFSAALSSGGLEGALLGRVGDVPLPGCGLFCGPKGTVACTGDGEQIALKLLAKQVYLWLEEGLLPEEASEKALGLFADSVEIGLIVLTKDHFSAKSSNEMAWSYIIEVN